MDAIIGALQLQDSPRVIPEGVRKLPVQLVAPEDRPPKIQVATTAPRAPEQPQISTWTWLKRVFCCRHSTVGVTVMYGRG
uniref:Uncharacterized protein n=1 Tax=Caenorhabditis tropicalis TaxID=1561998 RepID=A0A1I7T895_9PELO